MIDLQQEFGVSYLSISHNMAAVKGASPHRDRWPDRGLSRAGFIGPIDLLDKPDRFILGVLTGGMGQSWWLPQCYLKSYACCRYIHAATVPRAPARLCRKNQALSWHGGGGYWQT